MVGEVAAGIFACSLALIADAGHMLTDGGALGAAIVASVGPRRAVAPASVQRRVGRLEMADPVRERGHDVEADRGRLIEQRIERLVA